ncbi:MAG: phosphotransferase [Chloroflexi bacterium]|nr:phosphotransferase [Chloroflexota bacterium]
MLQTRDLPFVVCHADIHAGNVHITPAGDLYVVDWDTMILAPKERDLMFAGIGFGSAQFSPAEQAAFFLQGYGPAEVDAAALAYYRCERIVQDVYEYCLQILFTEGESSDRRNGLEQFRSQFEPGAVVDRAFLAIEALPPGTG